MAAIDAMSREALGEALRVISASTTTVAALRGLEALGPLRAMLMPVPLPTDLLLVRNRAGRPEPPTLTFPLAFLRSLPPPPFPSSSRNSCCAGA